MPVDRLVFGIGNPGPAYVGTRHNLGFDLVERFAADAFEPFPGLPTEIARVEIAGADVALIRPLTYVNRSGPLLAELVQRAGLQLESCLVAVDDIDLAVGTVRLRATGSAGGHNGLRSIEAALGTPDYPRLRLGVGGPDARAHPDYVLGRFPESEHEAVEASLDRAVAAVELWVEKGIEIAMSEVNRRLLDPGTDRP